MSIIFLEYGRPVVAGHSAHGAHIAVRVPGALIVGRWHFSRTGRFGACHVVAEPLPPLLRPGLAALDSVRASQEWLAGHYREPGVVQRAVERSGLAERTFKRRFRAATGSTLIDHVQDLRIGAAKRLLECERTAVDEISVEVGYEDASFFRRLFRRRTGLAPSEYRRLFQPIRMSGTPLPAQPVRYGSVRTVA